MEYSGRPCSKSVAITYTHSQACACSQARELIPPCDIRRREKVGALYSAVSGLLAVISRTCTLDFSLLCHGIYMHIYMQVHVCIHSRTICD